MTPFSFGVNMRNIKLTLSYDGSSYRGWQRQKNGITVQEVLEEKIKLLVNEPVKVLGSGRTDAGVHALNQVCNFKTQSAMEIKILQKGLNALLPADILVKQCIDAPPEFHARYSAKSKSYEYRILNRIDPDIFRRSYLWHIRQPLNIEAMKSCLVFIIGTHDFSAFKSAGSGNMNPVRTMIQAEVEENENGLLVFTFEADGFLRHMVRNLAGTLVEVGGGKMSAEQFRAVLEQKDRGLAGIKSPPQGLFLKEVLY
jgi:tRNA pseudouridine38-40 synthase